VVDTPFEDRSSSEPTAGARVLLADDNADMREYVRRLLERRYNVEAVADGLAALEAARRHLPDLVLTDVMMPRLDGFGLLRDLRNDPQTRTVPIIMLSARAGEESRVEGLEAGADDYLVKPFSARELLARVRANLEMARLRRELTAEIEAERSRLKYIFDKAPAYVLVLRGPQHVFESVNPAYVQLVGERELIGKTVPEAFPEIEGQGVQGRTFLEILDQVYRTGEPYVGQGVPISIRRKTDANPTRIFVDFVYQPIFDPHGRVSGIFVHGVDVTSQKENEEALRLSEQHLELLSNTVPALIFYLDQERRYRTCNDAFTDWFGVPREQIIGMMVREFVGEQAWEVMGPRLERAYAGETVDYEVEAPYRFGGTRWIHAVYTPHRDLEGKVIGVVAFATDITRNRQLLAQEQAARRDAETANRLKDEFLATVSHELRTPLTSILGWAHMLRTGLVDNNKAAVALEAMERNARTQEQLIDDLLDVSRIVSGKLRLDVQPIDPVTTIEAAIDSLVPAAEAKRLRITKVIDTGVGAISGDADRLQQIIWNLLSNAIKFTPAGGRIQIRGERVNSHIEIVVSDTGIGIKPEFVPYVFERFRQADATATRAYGGLGLGLAIVRHLVELHGGQVTADSAGEGQGATFTVKLPLLTVYQRESSEEPAHPGAGDYLSQIESVDRLDGTRILAVDDEPDTSKLLKTMIEESGGEVTIATSADEALNVLARGKFDLIVSDIGMPGKDGYQFIQEVRSRPTNRGGTIPAVALTAYARTEDRLRALRAGYQMHVPKPIEYAELITVIASLVGRNHNT